MAFSSKLKTMRPFDFSIFDIPFKASYILDHDLLKYLQEDLQYLSTYLQETYSMCGKIHVENQKFHGAGY